MANGKRFVVGMAYSRKDVREVQGVTQVTVSDLVS